MNSSKELKDSLLRRMLLSNTETISKIARNTYINGEQICTDGHLMSNHWQNCIKN